MNELFILIGPQAPDNVCWAERAVSGVISVGQCPLFAVADKVTGPYRTVVLVPGADVFISEVTLPAGNVKRAMAAIPFAMEESLAADVEELHFAHGVCVGQMAPVAVVARERMIQWLAMLRAAGLDPDVMIPAPLALPYNHGVWTIAAAADGVLVRSGIWQGYTIEPVNLRTVLALVLAKEVNKPKAISFYQCGDDLVDFAGLGVDIHQKDVKPLNGDEKLLAVLASSSDGAREINLLQGSFGRNAEWGKVWRRWRLAVVLLLISLGLALLSFSLDYMNLARESKALTTRINAVYLQTFPAAKKIVNVRAQMEDKLAKLRAGDENSHGFLGIIDGCGQVLLETKSFKLQGMRYMAGRLDLEFVVADLQVLDDLKERLVTAGFAVEIKTATSAAGKVQARLQLREQTKDAL